MDREEGRMARRKGERGAGRDGWGGQEGQGEMGEKCMFSDVRMTRH